MIPTLTVYLLMIIGLNITHKMIPTVAMKDCIKGRATCTSLSAFFHFVKFAKLICDGPRKKLLSLSRTCIVNVKWPNYKEEIYVGKFLSGMLLSVEFWLVNGPQFLPYLKITYQKEVKLW